MYKEIKATQIAAYILHLMGGGMPAEDLMRMLYLADREHYKTRGYPIPITGDDAVSSNRGPVLWKTQGILDGTRQSEHWGKFISPANDGQVTLVVHIGESTFYTVTNPDDGPFEVQFYDNERDAAKGIIAKYGGKKAWSQEDIVREFPQLLDGTPEEPIPIPAILQVLGYTPDEIETIMETLRDVGPNELGQLNGAERDAAKSVVAKYRDKKTWSQDDIAREFPEMRDVAPGEPIPIPSILQALGYTPDEIEGTLEYLEENEELDAIHARTGDRDWSNLHSDWCNQQTALALGCNTNRLCMICRPYVYREIKTSQLAAYILHLMGGEMSADNLMRMLRLTDMALKGTEWFPATGDEAIATDKGPVLRQTQSIMDGTRQSEHWRKFISPVKDGRVTLVGNIGESKWRTSTGPTEGATQEHETGRSELTRLDKTILDAAKSVVAKYGDKTTWSPEDIAREFPDMRDIPLGEPIDVLATVRELRNKDIKVE